MSDRTDGPATGGSGDSSGDDELERDLRRMFAERDPLPERVIEMGRAAFAWRTIDEELEHLAEVLQDPFGDVDEALAVRGADAPRTWTFQAGPTLLDVEISAEAAGLRIRGHVVPPGPYDVEVQGPPERPPASSDREGRFDVAVPGGGPLRFVCRRSGQTATLLVTPWILV